MTDAEMDKLEARLDELVAQTKTMQRREGKLRPIVAVMFLVGMFTQSLPIIMATTALCIAMTLYAMFHLARLTWFGRRADSVWGQSDR